MLLTVILNWIKTNNDNNNTLTVAGQWHSETGVYTPELNYDLTQSLYFRKFKSFFEKKKCFYIFMF